LEEKKEMTRNYCLQVFLEPKQYIEILQEAKATGITFKNDSELIRKILNVFYNDFPALKMQNEALKKAISQRDAIISEMEEKNAAIKDKKNVDHKR
jgi:hypothetical protein